MKGKHTVNIPGELASVASNGVVASADGIYDYNQNKSQEDINSETVGRLSGQDAKINEKLGEIDQKYDEFEDKTDEYFKQESAKNNQKIEEGLENVGAVANNDVEVVDVLPDTGVANKTYRVTGEYSYADYAYFNSEWKKLAEYDRGVDDEPIAGSENLVTSGGVKKSTVILNQKDSLIGKGANWTTKSMKSIILKKGLHYEIKVSNTGSLNIPNGVVNSSIIFKLQLFSVASNSAIKDVAFIQAPNEIDTSISYVVVPTEDAYVYIEGRWESETTITIHVQYYTESTFDLASIVYASSRNVVFDNTEKTLTIPPFSLHKKDGNVVDFPETVISYDFKTSTTAWWVIVAEISSLSVKVVSWRNIKPSDKVLGTFVISKNDFVSSFSSAFLKGIIDGTNKEIENDIKYSPEYQIAPIVVADGDIKVNNVDGIIKVPDLFIVNKGVVVKFVEQDLSFDDIDPHYTPHWNIVADFSSKTYKLDKRNSDTGKNAIVASMYVTRNPTKISYFKKSTVCDAYIDGKVSNTYGAYGENLEKQIENNNNNINIVISGVKESIIQEGAGATWLKYNYNSLNPAIPSYYIFKNNFTNAAPEGAEVALLIYGKKPDSETYTLVKQLPKNTYIGKWYKIELPKGYEASRVEIRVAQGETLEIEGYQPGIYESIEEHNVGIAGDVLQRNLVKDTAIRSVGKILKSGEITPLAFMHISDTHTKAGKESVCVRNARTLMDYYTNLKFCIITGDIVYDTFADQMTYYDEAIEGSSSMFLHVIGNHDAGQPNESVGWLNSVGNDQQVYDKFIAPYKNRWNLGNGDTGKCYYYKDFEEEKIRLIVLYQFETDFEKKEDGSQLKYWREYVAFRQAQVDWLINTLNNTPDDYGVMVSYHIHYDYKDEDNAFITEYLKGHHWHEYAYQSDKYWLHKILTAFQKHETLELTWNQTGGVVCSLNASCDFTQNEAEFICILAGHTHDDYIGHSAQYPNLPVLVVGSDNLHYTGKSCPRAYDTPSEDLINIVNVDRNRKTITVIRVGSDVSITGQNRSMITIKYAE